ncbi:membrane protein related to Kef-type K+ transport system NAD-binding component [Paraglaciecola polaris LMG 21857]|uniref:Membrane protein related to Kef-type K+ transport system NAD-binding component n=4 Tax=Paraglaciecola polaris TaxID=222814 RepID=K6ZWX1_9ALTE|nr:membrane protein related to Kef-type K+ transport system NAD-binding component [Paraglaciecola polaris LMG 21857]|tara:strand:+ start:2477 stop:2869 length:393 start_codon:yes stop_codon:yes gene_type:complete
MLISLLGVAMALTLHYVNISWLADRISGKLHSKFAAMHVILLIAVCSQMLIAGLFCLCYLIGVELDLGEFNGRHSVKDIYYFSLTTITTLGLGSSQPTEDLRMIAGVESATGFLLISCSASKLFTCMTNK